MLKETRGASGQLEPGDLDSSCSSFPFSFFPGGYHLACKAEHGGGGSFLSSSRVHRAGDVTMVMGGRFDVSLCAGTPSSFVLVPAIGVSSAAIREGRVGDFCLFDVTPRANVLLPCRPFHPVRDSVP